MLHLDRSFQSAVYYTNSSNTAASGCFLLSAFWIFSSASYRVPVVSLPSLRRHVPGRRSGPWFSGVTQLPAGSCFLLFCPLPLLLVLLPPLPLCCLNSATDESNLNPWRLSAPFLLVHEGLCPRARPTFLIVPWILPPPRDGPLTPWFSAA